MDAHTGPEATPDEQPPPPPEGGAAELPHESRAENAEASFGEARLATAIVRLRATLRREFSPSAGPSESDASGQTIPTLTAAHRDPGEPHAPDGARGSDEGPIVEPEPTV